MAEPGLFLWRFEGVDERRTSVSTERSRYENWRVLRCIGLRSVHCNDNRSGRVPPAPLSSHRAHLRHPRPALWRHHPPRRFLSRRQAFWRRRPKRSFRSLRRAFWRASTASARRAQSRRPRTSTSSGLAAMMRRHVAHHWIAPRRDKSTPRTILAQNIAPTLPAVSPAPEEGRPFLSQLERQRSLRSAKAPPGSRRKRGGATGLRPGIYAAPDP